MYRALWLTPENNRTSSKVSQIHMRPITDLVSPVYPADKVRGGEIVLEGLRFITFFSPILYAKNTLQILWCVSLGDRRENQGNLLEIASAGSLIFYSK